MAVVGDIVELLGRWDRWKRVNESPERIDALEKRITELEARLQRAPGEACPKCGALEFRTDKQVPVSHGPFAGMGMGVMERHLKCAACGHTEMHHDTPGRAGRR
jgi:predicted nucleic-acid-binding Zn-ribbon protein